MKVFTTLTNAALLASALIGTAAYADALVLTDPIQLGRLSRNNVAQDWSHFEFDPATNGEQFPGVINATAQYHYHAYYYNVGLTNFLQFSIDSTSRLTFFSAYQTFYNPANLGQNWLGDAGSSGNFAFDSNPGHAVDGRFFQVVAGINTTLIVIVNETTANQGIGAPFDMLAEAFTDSGFNSDSVVLTPVAVGNRIPEPSTLALLVMAPLGLILGRRARRRSSCAAKLAIA